MNALFTADRPKRGSVVPQGSKNRQFTTNRSVRQASAGARGRDLEERRRYGNNSSVRWPYVADSFGKSHFASLV